LRGIEDIEGIGGGMEGIEGIQKLMHISASHIAHVPDLGCKLSHQQLAVMQARPVLARNFGNTGMRADLRESCARGQKTTPGCNLGQKVFDLVN
jgi:hypothetical protein